MTLPAGLLASRAEGMGVTRIDPGFPNLFKMEWLVVLDPTSEDDYTRAVAEKASVVLESARFMAAQETPRDVEVRVWVEAACASACISITWEPGIRRFGFHLLDESLRERLACVVFDAIPSVGAEESESQSERVLDAARKLAASRRVPVDGPKEVQPEG